MTSIAKILAQSSGYGGVSRGVGNENSLHILTYDVLGNWLAKTASSSGGQNRDPEIRKVTSLTQRTELITLPERVGRVNAGGVAIDLQEVGRIGIG
jgi:hypothetical protein